MSDLSAVAAAFGSALHDAGVPATPERAALFARTVTMSDTSRIDDVYWLGRISFVSSHEQIPVYDALFTEYFRGNDELADFLGEIETPPLPSSKPSNVPGSDEKEKRPDDYFSSQVVGESEDPDDINSADQDDSVELAVMSSQERLGSQDFAACSPEELALLQKLVASLRLVPPMRRVRRTRASHRGRRLDLRASLRAAARTGGDPIHLAYRRRRTRPRRVVLIADVSASMEPYSRIYLHLMRGAVRAINAEAFVFATRLTRITRLLNLGSVDRAYAAVSRAAPDWSGGTQIGRALMNFMQQHGRRGVAHGAIIVIVSDGWETEDPALVGEAMSHLNRLAHRIIWVNPRKAAKGYRPLAGGMAAALPYVDDFISGHSLIAVDEVLAAIAAS